MDMDEIEERFEMLKVWATLQGYGKLVAMLEGKLSIQGTSAG